MPQAALRSNEALRARRARREMRRGRTLSSSARGDTTAYHGPLQRLLDRRVEGRTHTLNLRLLR